MKRKRTRTHKSKRVPSFWWKFEIKKNRLVVKSDSDRYPIVGYFEYGVCADIAIENAEQLIADFRSGRKTPVSIPRC